MRKFIFEWYKKEKYGEPIVRKNEITVSADIKDIGKAAEAATNLFTKSFGSLKKNEIKTIQEINEKGEPVGEVITPVNGTTIEPTRR